MTSKPITDFNPVGTAASLSTALDISKLTKGEDAPAGTRALLIGTSGTLNFVTAAGATRNDVPVLAGVLPVAIKTLLAGGTADDVWAMV